MNTCYQQWLIYIAKLEQIENEIGLIIFSICFVVIKIDNKLDNWFEFYCEIKYCYLYLISFPATDDRSKNDHLQTLKSETRFAAATRLLTN